MFEEHCSFRENNLPGGGGLSSGRRRQRFQRRLRWTLRRESISRVYSLSRRNALRSGSLIPVVAVVSPGSKALAAPWESGSAGPLVQAARPAIRMRQGNNLFMGSHLAGDPSRSSHHAMTPADEGKAVKSQGRRIDQLSEGAILHHVRPVGAGCQAGGIGRLIESASFRLARLPLSRSEEASGECWLEPRFHSTCRRALISVAGQ